MSEPKSRHTLSSLARRSMYRYLLMTVITGASALAWIAVGMAHLTAVVPCLGLAVASAWATTTLTKETARMRTTYLVERTARRQRVWLAREAKGIIEPDRSSS